MSFSEDDKKFLSYLAVYVCERVLDRLPQGSHERKWHSVLSNEQIRERAEDVYANSFKEAKIEIFDPPSAPGDWQTDVVGQALTRDMIQHALRLLGPKKTEEE